MSRRPAIIAVVVVLLAAAGAWQLLVKSPRQEATSLQAQVVAQRTALLGTQSELAAAETAKARYRAAYTEVLRLGKAVPEDDDLQSLLVQLSATAARSKVRFVSLARGGAGTGALPAATGATTQAPLPPGVTVGTSGFPTLGLKLTFSGRYFRLADFLERIDDYVRTGRTLRVRGRLLTIDGVSLSKSGSGRRLSAEVSATAYLVLPAGDATNGAMGSAPAGAVSATPTPATGSNG